MMFLDLVSELEKKHDTFDKHCYDNRQVYSLESIADLQQAQQPKSDVVYFTYDLSTLHNRKLPRNLIFCGESSFISEQLIPNTIQMPEKEMSIFLEDAEELLHSNYKLQDIYIQMLNAVMRGKGIGAMLENVGNALNTSIAIIDMSGKVISNSIPFQVDEPVWQESIKNGYCPPLFIEHIKDVKSQHGEEGGNGPFLRHCIDNHLFYLSNRIILQGELYGYIFMIQGERAFDPLCYSVLPLITQITTDLILKEQNMDVDFIPIHHYWNWYADEGAQAFLDLVDETWKMYHKPIWITEFAISGDPGKTKFQRKVVMRYMKKVIAGLDKKDYVERYAWFSFSPTDYKNGGSGLLNHYEGKITDLGYLYQKLGMPKGYDRNNPVKAKANPKEDVIKKYYITVK